MNAIRFILGILAVLLGKTGGAGEPTALPRTKMYIQPCMQAAFTSHPGKIEKFQVRHKDEALYFRLEIQARDGPEWIMLCDGLTGQIIREQKLDDVWP